MQKFLWIVFLGVIVATGTALAQQEIIVQGQDIKGVPRAVSTDTDGRAVGQISVVDDCEVVPGWTALSNDTTGIETDLDHVMGANSLEFAKVDGVDNLTVGGIQKTITALNLAFLVENGGAFGYSLNVSANTDIDYCFLRMGTDASNFNEWRVEGTGLSAGWNSLRFNTNAPATAGATGNGWNPSVVTYIALGCAFDLETDALADIRVDHLIVHVGLQVAADINASVSSSAGASKVDLIKVLGTPTDVDAGNSGLGTQRVVNATDDPNLSKLTVEDMDTAAPIDNKQAVVSMLPSATGATLPDVGAGNVGGGTPRVTLGDDDPAVTNLTAISGKLTSDNDNKELADYVDSTSQLPPLYVDDATLLLDNKPMANVMAEVYELLEDVRVAASADGMAYTKDGLKGEAVVYLDNGATLDMAKAGATGGVQSETVNWPNSYDPGNAQQDFNKKNTQPVLPVKETTATIGAAAVTCFASREIIRDPNWTLTFKNTDPADPMTNIDIEQSPNGVDWTSFGWALCNALAAGKTCYYSVAGSSFRYIRGRCTAAAGPNEASSEVHYTANKN